MAKTPDSQAQGKAGEVLVGSGSFRIDPSRALEVLRSQQVEADEDRMAFWIRAAVLRGAPRADFTWGPLSLTIRFGGKPLTATELGDPFSCLLSGSSADPASRWLALAMLHTGRPKVTVTVESGPSDRRKALFLDDNGLAEARASTKGSDTIVKVRWPLIIGVFADRRHPYCWSPPEVRARLDPCPMPVHALRRGDRENSLRFEPVAPDKRGVPLKEVRKGGLRILLRPSDGLGIDVRFCVAGVAIESLAKIPFPIPWSAWVDDPEIELDASLKSPIRGERWNAALKAVEEAAVAHSLRLMRRQEHVMPLVGNHLVGNPWFRWEWKRMRKPGLSALVARFEKERRRRGVRRLLGGKLSGDWLRVLECAMVCAHLRGPAKAMSRAKRWKSHGPVKACLYDVPLYCDKDGEPLSEKDLVGMQRSRATY